MSVSIKDVAVEAGVSKTTVSAAIHNPDIVKTETRERIYQAIKKLGYMPNLAARELITNTKLNLGIVNLVYDLPHLDQKGYFEQIHESTYFDIASIIIDEISKTKYGLLNERVQVSEKELELPSFVTSGRVAGLFVVGTMHSAKYIEYLHKHVEHIVTVGNKSAVSDCVRNDYVQSSYTAVQHLINHGHKRIAFINGDSLSQATPDKLKGYKMALADAYIEYDETLVRNARFTGRGGYEAFRFIWEMAAEKPTAAFFAADVLAVGAARYMYEKRIRIPDDVSVIGYEDCALAEFMTPPLTTISRNKNRLGHEACVLMLNKLDFPTRDNKEVIVPFSLIERNSVVRLISK